MPEIKNAFTQGKMNKDLDERLVPNGQYRDAVNIQVSTSEGSDVGTVQNILGNIRVDDIVPIGDPNDPDFKCIGSIANEKTDKLYWFVTSDNKDAILEYKKGTLPEPIFVDIKTGTEDAVLKFQDNIITGISIIDNMLFWTDNNSEPKKINIDRCKKGTVDFNSHTQLWVDKKGGDQSTDITEDHITVIKKKPIKTLNVKIIPGKSMSSSNLFEKIFCRFAYRYKYEDGEYSAFSPFTNVVFDPRYAENYDKDNAFSTDEPYNTAMTSSIKGVELTDFITPDMPEDVVQIDILYKQEDSPNVYSVAKIKPNDSEWTNNGSNQGSGFSSSYKGRYILRTENIYATLPQNQTLRPWDNVPRKALAQEVTGNRIVYGNYTQNYDLGLNPDGDEISPGLITNYNVRNNKGSFEEGGLPSVKSQRNYQLGIVFGDKYGRETPIHTSTDATVKIPWGTSEIPHSASKSLQLTTKLTSFPPSWANYYKFYVKETSGEYYNLVMDKTYIPTLDEESKDSQDHIWLSFPSSDRNKITDESYLTLKKKIGIGETQTPFENRFKILDIKNEAPDAIKYKFRTIGSVTNAAADYGGTGLDTFSTSLNDAGGSNDHDTALFPTMVVDGTSGITDGVDANPGRIDFEQDEVHVHYHEWMFGHGQLQLFGPGEGGDAATGHDNSNNPMYLSWYKTVGGVTEFSKRYKVAEFTLRWKYDPDFYKMKLEEKISENDALLARVSTWGAANSGSGSTKDYNFDPNLTFRVERKDLKELDEFSGRFFVKVVSDAGQQRAHPLQPGINIENNVVTALLDGFSNQSQKDIYWFVDGQDASINASESDGVVNAQFSGTAPATNVASIENGSVTPITNTQAAWAALATLSSSASGSTENNFFIDNMYFCGGNSSWESYARDAGDIVQGTMNRYTKITWTNQDSDHYHWRPFDHDDRNINIYNAARNVIMTNTDTFASGILPGAANKPVVNGMEGIILTDGTHTDNDLNGIRRWRTNEPLASVGESGQGEGYSFDNTYGEEGETGKYFIHLSYLAPGGHLVPDDVDITNATLKGKDSLANHLQGIWGGGVFNKKAATTNFGSSSERIIEMEGNYSPLEPAVDGVVSQEPRKQAPGPGVGIGYDSKYAELHYNQWNPAYPASRDPDKKIQDFVSSIDVGNKFKFAGDESETVYTILSKSIKRIYNHTPWRRRKVYNGTDFVFGGDSVEEAAETWGDTANSSGVPTAVNAAALVAKIKDFGKRNNRRVCYIIEVDKNPMGTGAAYNPVDGSELDARTATKIQFIKSDPRKFSGRESKQPAIWETEPKKSSDLDIYYEASNAIPTQLDLTTTEIFAPVGCRVEFVDKMEARSAFFNITDDIHVDSWNGPDADGHMKFTVSEHPNVDTAGLVIDGEFDDAQDLATGSSVNWTSSVAPVDASTPTAGSWLITTNQAEHTPGATGSLEQDMTLEEGVEYSIFMYIAGSGDINLIGAATGGGNVIVNTDYTNGIGVATWVQGNINTDKIVIEQDSTGDAIIYEVEVHAVSGGFNAHDANGISIDYSNSEMRFFRQDGSYVTALVDHVPGILDPDQYRREFKVKSIIDTEFETGLSWYNCFSFGNGIESNRIRDGFNEMQISNGAMASSTIEEPYQEENRKHGLIYSGLYNSNAGVNNLNQFIMAEKITKDLNPTFGSIQKLFQRRASLITFCEDRVINILSNRDALYSADGNPQLIASNAVLGDATPFVGDYGISKNPESFAKESYRAYFADKQRGAILRLSKDGITPISDAGMHDWFRDNLSTAGYLIGTYDEFKKDYNLTLMEPIAENLLINADITEGEEVVQSIPANELVVNGGINMGIPLVMTTPDPENMDVQNELLTSQTTTKNWPAIPAGDLQGAVAEVTEVNEATVFDSAVVDIFDADFSVGGNQPNNPFENRKGSPAAYVRRKNYTGSYNNHTILGGQNSGSNIEGAYSANNYPNKTWGGDSYNNNPTSISVYSNNNRGNVFWNNATNTKYFGIVFQHFSNLACCPYLSLGNGSAWSTSSWLTFPGSPATSPQPYATGGETTIYSDADNDVLSTFTGATNTTIFNGEEIEIEFEILTNGSPTASGWDANTVSYTNTVNVGGTGSSARGGFKIVLCDGPDGSGTPHLGSFGSTVLGSGFLIDPGTAVVSATDPFTETTIAPNTADLSYNSIVATGLQKSWQTSSTVVFPELRRDDLAKNHRCYFKFNDGTSEEKILINDLRVRLVFHTTQESKQCQHVVKNFRISKVSNMHNTSNFIPFQPAIEAAPAIAIPEWTEVSHDLPPPTSWTNVTPLPTDAVVKFAYTASNDLNFGPNTSTPNTVDYNQWNSNDPTAPIAASFTIPSGLTWDITNPASPTLTGTQENGISTPANTDSGIYTYDIYGTQINPPSITTMSDTFYVDSTAGDKAYITQDISGTPLVENNWYLVNIKYVDSSATSSPIDPPTGAVLVHGVMDTNIGAGIVGSGITTGAVGTVRQSELGIKSMELALTNQGLLSGDLTAIFQLHPNSYVNGNNNDGGVGVGITYLDRIKLEFDDFKGEITEIQLINVSESSSGGTADNWNSPVDNLNQGVNHSSFHTPSVWFNNNAWNWDATATGTHPNKYIKQHFDPNITPQASNDGYEFKFTVSKIDASTPVSGALKGYVNNAIGDAGPGIFEGFFFSNIEDEGDYTVHANFSNFAPTPFTIKKDSNTYSTGSVVQSSTVQSTTATNLDNQICFKPMTDGFVGSVSNISLKDITNFFSGGTSNAWSFNGFDTTVEEYIVFNFANQYIEFNSAPVNKPTTLNPPWTYNGPVRVQQVITRHINHGEKFKIKFDYYLDDGNILEGYYFNHLGQGFRLNTITLSGQGFGTYSQVHTIGDATASDTFDTYIDDDTVTWPYGELKETFVLYVGTGSTDVTGYIDNAYMQQVFDYTPVTVTYSEDVKGWVSFKSFILEHASSLAKNYFTMYRGGLYEHHAELDLNGNPNRNTFYGIREDSSVTALLNAQPSSVKIFNTLNYEGSQSQIYKYDPTDFRSIEMYNTKEDVDDAGVGIGYVSGWYVDYLQTDKQRGTLNEFIEKEGKWFNYIRGDVDDIKTADLSFQGLGIISSIS